MVDDTPKTMSQLDAEAMNERSHTTKGVQYSNDPEQNKKSLDELRVKAKNEISRCFNNGKSLEHAWDIAENYPGLSAEMEYIIEHAASKHGDVPLTKAEAAEREQEEAKQIQGAMMGVPMGIAAGATAMGQGVAISQSLRDQLSQYNTPPQGLSSDQAMAEVINAQGNNILGSGLEGFADLSPTGFSPSDAQVTHGTPGKVRGQAETLVVS